MARIYGEFTPELRKTAMELAKKVGVTSAALEMGISKSAVHKWCAENGVHLPEKRRTYSAEEMERAVRLAVKEDDDHAALELGIPHSTVQGWRVNVHGIKRRKYSADDRERAVQLASEKGTEFAAIEVGVSYATLKNWQRKVHGTTQRSYSVEEMERGVQLVSERGLTFAAVELGIPNPTLKSWFRKIHGSKGVTYSVEEIGRAVRIASEKSVESAAAELGIPYPTLQAWCVNAGSSRGRNYSVEEKERAVRLASDKGIEFAALELDISYSTLKGWYREVHGSRKTRSSAEERKLAVQLAVENGVDFAASKLNISSINLRRWITKVHGLKKPKYSADDKEKAVQLATEKGVRFAAQKLDIRPSTLRNWYVKVYGTQWDIYKYSAEQKEAALNLLRQNDGNAPLVASQTGMRIGAVEQIWAAAHPKAVNTYSAAQRKAAVSRAVAVGAVKAGLELGINPSTIKNWRTAAREKGELPVRRRVNDHADIELEWVSREYPELEVWRGHALIWLSVCTNNIGLRLRGLRVFFRDYLLGLVKPEHGLLTPAEFFSRGLVLPNLFKLCCRDSSYGRGLNNVVHEFLQWLLLEQFSLEDDYGRSVVSPAFHNPVSHIQGFSDKREESVYSPLPYGYVDELRSMLAQGPNFRDWKRAQSLFSKDADLDQRGVRGSDWYRVSEEKIDTSDPDCVWRHRSRPTDATPILEMWSPVRWVALLTKMILPLRTFQVRMLDSGEADTWRYSEGLWIPNTNSLRGGSERKPLEQGVFRRLNSSEMLMRDDMKSGTELYINTNKTNDIAKSGAAKGYSMPWVTLGSLHNDVYYWLEKLRNWQEKYNPVRSRTSWNDLILGRHLHAKSDVQLASYPDACFLFRLAEDKNGERNLPLAAFILDLPWYFLLRSFQERLAKRGERHADGSPIVLVYPREASPESGKKDTKQDVSGGNRRRTYFPLHSLRVSIITSLAIDGELPFPILQKLAGHSRLLMTLYYTKINGQRMQAEINKATIQMEQNKQRSIIEFLRHTEYQELVRQAICNSEAALGAAIPEHPAARNPAGWMLMHHGACLVGGNTSPLEDTSGIGGCYNGGPCVRNAGGASIHAPVSGGARNCTRCRWFVTTPPYLAALVAHGNVIGYHLDRARDECAKQERLLSQMVGERADAENRGAAFEKVAAMIEVERLLESAAARFNDRIDDFAACWQLIQRCRDALNKTDELKPKSVLVLGGSVSDFEVAIKDTDSELLQLCVVCETVELYPDHGTEDIAIIHRGQLLDAALLNENIRPVFLTLSKEEQLKVGNEFVRNLAQICNPQSWHSGRDAVVAAIDNKIKLSTLLGVDIENILSASLSSQPVQLSLPKRIGDDKKN